jgi:hypothetical protein
MDPQDFTEEQWRKALLDNIVEKNPDLFEDENKRALLLELTNLHRRFSKDYFNLRNLIQDHEEVAKLFYSYMDYYPELRSKWGPLNKEAEDHGVRRYLDDVVGTNSGAVSKKYDKRNPDMSQALVLIRDYILTAKEPLDKALYADLPPPPHSDLLRCTQMMVDPEEGLKEKYDGTVFEPYLELIYQEGLKIAESNTMSEGITFITKKGHITKGIKKKINDTIRSLKNKGLL